MSDPTMFGHRSPPPPIAGTVAEWWADDLSSATVDSWIDRKQGVTLTASGSARPSLVAAGIGGRPAVDFNGTSHVLRSSVFSTEATGAVVAVVQYATTANRALWSQSRAASTSLYMYLSPATGTNVMFLDRYAGGVQQYSGTTAIGLGKRIVEVSADGTGISMRLDGSPETTSGTGAGWFSGVTAADTWMIGGLAYSSGVIGWLAGRVAYLIRTDTPLSAGDRTALYAWISDYYGV